MKTTNTRHITFAICAVFAAELACAQPAMSFASGTKVTIDDPFWSPRLDIWRTNTIRDVFHKFETRSRALENFDRAGRRENSGHHGECFFDGLVYECIRGASDYLARTPSAELDGFLDRTIDRILAAQQPDGYLHTWVQLGHQDKRWGDNGGCLLVQHDIYNAGALIEAGVHHYRATGKTKLLAAGIRFANLLCDTMGPRPKRNLIPNHSLAEEALVKLARLLKDEPSLAARADAIGRPEDYLALVRFWFTAHGDHCGLPDCKLKGYDHVQATERLTSERHDVSWRPALWDYQMDAKPLREYRAIEGHAVRAVLLTLGLAAYAKETDDRESMDLALRFWESMTGRKMYITGGVGTMAEQERFGDDYELPPDAYLETCAAIASAFTSGCLAEITGDGKFMDEFERVIYNALLTAVGENGRTYTYQNPLNTDKGSRWDWHDCPCCPPMFLKLTGALPGYIYSSGTDGLSVNLFIGGSVTLNAADCAVTISQRTRYPEDGRVLIAVDPAHASRFALRVRIPGWVRGVENHMGLYVAEGTRTWSVALNGTRMEPVVNRGYAIIDREWSRGDRVELKMDVSPRTVRANSRVAAVRGLHAVVRGPVVMAMENGRSIPYWRIANDGPAPHQVWVKD